MSQTGCRVGVAAGLIFFAIAPSASAIEISLGVNSSQTQLRVTKGDGDKGGTMAEKISEVPFVSLTTRPHDIGRSRFGYFFEFWGGYYNINRQIVKGSYVSLDSRVHGGYGYLTPVLCYRLASKDESRWNASIGLGLGLGYLSTKGAVVLTDEEPDERRSVNDQALGYSVGVHFQVGKGKWFARLSDFSPVIRMNGYEFMFHNVSLGIGRRFVLFEKKEG